MKNNFFNQLEKNVGEIKLPDLLVFMLLGYIIFLMTGSLIFRITNIIFALAIFYKLIFSDMIEDLKSTSKAIKRLPSLVGK